MLLKLYIYIILLFAIASQFLKFSTMSAFDLTKFNNINNMLSFKLNNPPQLDYGGNKNIFYTTWCLAKYYQNSEQPKLYGPDFVVIHYTYWHSERGYDECKQNNIEHEYDKDVRPSWDDAASYHEYEYDSDDDYDRDSF
jgi:hypothetical protein